MEAHRSFGANEGCCSAYVRHHSNDFGANG